MTAGVEPADSLAARTATALSGGDRSQLGSRVPVRERLRLLLDAGSWTEDGLLANSAGGRLPADGVVTGVGAIGGRRVAVIAHDFGVKAGSWGELNCREADPHPRAGRS